MANNNSDTIMSSVEFTEAPPPWEPVRAPQTPPGQSGTQDPRLPYPTIKGQVDYELYKVWREHVRQGLERNDQMFRKLLNAFMRPYQLIIWMNIILFTIGIASFITAIVLSVTRDQPLYAAVFAGLSAATFIGFFISRPMRALEENLEFITWLGMIYNTYWARVVYAMDQQTVQQDLSSAIKESSDEIDRLVQRHAEMAGKRPATDAG